MIFLHHIKDKVDFLRKNLGFASRFGRKKFAFVLFISILQGMAQVANVVSIAPLMALASDNRPLRNFIQQSPYLAPLAELSDWQLLLMAVALLLSVALVSTVINILAEWTRANFAFGFSHHLRKSIMERLGRRPYTYFVERNPTLIVNNLQVYTEHYVANVLLQLLELFARMVLVALLLGLVLWVNWQLALIAASSLAIAYICIFVGLSRVRSNFRELMFVTGNATMQQAAQYVQGIRTLRLQNAEGFYRQQYLRHSQERAAVMGRQSVVNQFPKYVMEFALFFVLSAALLYITRQPTSFAAYLPTLAVLGLASYRLMPAVQQIYYSASQVSSYAHTFELLEKELADSEPVHISVPVVLSNLKFETALVFSNVCFHYPKANDVTLRSINLQINKGECVGICGKSGAGKSTLIDVLLGLLPPTSGSVLVDAVELRDEMLADWRSRIGYVPQDIFLIDDTVAQNIALGKVVTADDDEQVHRAAQLAQIHDFISALPEGYQTRVGDRGVRLSGGQRQRIALARALYHQPEILVLDEATSALDNETEAALIEAIESLHGTLTIIMIAHRLSTLRHCDYIIRLEDGRLATEQKSRQLK